MAGSQLPTESQILGLDETEQAAPTTNDPCMP